MNKAERTVFWNTLCSLDGKDLQQDAQKLKECITLPRYLYRYRPVTLSTIDALQRNRPYYSNANYYVDPFDTMIYPSRLSAIGYTDGRILNICV